MNKELYDAIIVGGGPAGLTAALYLARARYRVLVIEKEVFGGQITITSNVVNYPGIMQDAGEDITSVIRKQAQSFGAEFKLTEVSSIDFDGDEKTVHTTQGELKAFGIIIATGAHPREIGFDGEQEFKGRGVAYCATCDGEFFTGLDVFVAGGGFAAAEESVFLTKYAKHVYVLVRRDDFSCAKATADLVKNNENITVYYNTAVESVSGDSELKLLKMKNTKTGEITEYKPPEGETFGLFIFAGYEPATDIIKDKINLDDRGYVVTDENGKTNIEGVYAAGDLRQKSLRQMVTATSDGATAATELERYIAAMQKKTGKIPELTVTRTENASHGEDKDNHVNNSDLFTEDIRNQLKDLFSKMETNVILKLQLDDSPTSSELKEFIGELDHMTDKISVEIDETDHADKHLPCVRIFNHENKDSGAAFHGVPGGHEFNSFIIGLYNVSGPGQPLSDEITDKIKSLKKQVNMKILVSLSCTKCPELVTAAQKIAVTNPMVTAEAFDLNHFPDIQEKYDVMSVPCLVVNDKDVTFGKKSINQLIDYLDSVT